MSSYTSSSNIFNGVPLVMVAYKTGKLIDMNAITINSITTVYTPTTGKRARILGGTISVSATASVLFEDNASGTTVFRSPLLLANTPYDFDLGYGVLLGAINNVLKGTASANAAITGMLYVEEQSS